MVGNLYSSVGFSSKVADSLEKDSEKNKNCLKKVNKTIMDTKEFYDKSKIIKNVRKVNCVYPYHKECYSYQSEIFAPSYKEKC